MVYTKTFQKKLDALDKLEGTLDSREFRKQWYLTRKGAYKNSHLKTHYGITVDDLITLLEKQDFICPICKRDLSILDPKNVHIDHCHDTLSIRGVLCNRCNMALGLLQEDKEIVKACLTYLEKTDADVN